MIYHSSFTAVMVFAFFVAVVLGISFYFGSKAKSAKGYYAAHGQIHWFVNGIAFAGDYLSAASFLGICGMIAFYGYDGFLYSIGYLAGWIVALFVIAEPLKRLGRFTFADALDNKFNSRGIKLAAAISTLVVSIFYLIPQMVGAGALIKPLLGFEHYQGVLIVGVVVILIVVTAGMVSTSYVQFIKGSLLVFCCLILTVMILRRGLQVNTSVFVEVFNPAPAAEQVRPEQIMREDGGWVGKPYVRVKDGGEAGPLVFRKSGPDGGILTRTQSIHVTMEGSRLIQGFPLGEAGNGVIMPVGWLHSLPGSQTQTGPLGPISYLTTLADSQVVLWGSEKNRRR